MDPVNVYFCGLRLMMHCNVPGGKITVDPLFVYPALYLCGSTPFGSVGFGMSGMEPHFLGLQTWWVGESHTFQRITI